MSARLEGKVAIITGAGSGIGKEMAVLFANEGACVVVVDIVADGVNEVVSGINGSGGKAVGVTGDVTSEADIEKMIAAAVDNYGGLNILCNNAGVMDNMMPVTDVTDQLWERVININLNGPFKACRKAIPLMMKKGGGVILNMASHAGLFGCRAGVAYTASKHALVGITKSIAYMYANKGIRCNAICPGGVETPINDITGFNEFGFERQMTGLTTMPRMGSPKEIANVAMMLVSDEASFVNGAVVPVDAGWSAY